MIELVTEQISSMLGASFSDLSAFLHGLNLSVLAHLAGALVLGMIVGYERTYQGRAAGMRTFGIVCMASCSVVLLAAHPSGWYGGGRISDLMAVDGATRLISGLVTGVGFLGAGLIRRDEHHTSGLTTAAAVWASCAIGIQVGVGLYASAVLMALLCLLCMVGGKAVERRLPSRQAYAVSLKAAVSTPLTQDEIEAAFRAAGYRIDEDTMTFSMDPTGQVWNLTVQQQDGSRGARLSNVSQVLTGIPGVYEFQVAGARS